MRAGLRVGLDHDRSGPQLLGAGARRRDCGGAAHARRLRRVGIELAGADDAHAVQAPVGAVVAHRRKYEGAPLALDSRRRAWKACAERQLDGAASTIAGGAER
jgi:hypothetical protein